jgi:predicted PurR-regulated permease PerM
MQQPSFDAAGGMLASKQPFSRVGVVMLVLFGAVFAWLAMDLLLLLFAGILLAIFLRSLAIVVSERTPMSTGWALFVVVLALLSSMVGAGLRFAPQLAKETQKLAETLPEAVEELEQQIRSTDFGDWILDRVIERATQPKEGSGENSDNEKEDKEKQQASRKPPAAAAQQEPGEPGEPGEEEDKEKPKLQDAQDAVVEQAAGVAWRVVDGLIAFIIIVFTGLYLAAHPQPYIRGLLRMFPLARRDRIGEVVYACGYTLRWWLFGQLLAMVVVGVLMGVGLAIIGVPLAFALGMVAGLFEFIPTLGPMLGVLPALLLALSDSGATALWVLGLYSVVQTFEAYLLTPLVQQRVVHLPPVVTISAQIFAAWTVGPIGLLIAVPLVAVVMVVVQMLYVEDFLGDDMRVEAADQGELEHAKAAPLDRDEEDDD